MIANIIRVNEASKIALAKKASNPNTPFVFYVFWDKEDFLPKVGHSYKIAPCHEWVASELVHGKIYDFVSMEDSVNANSPNKRK